jgi:hypothetical protein
MEPGVAGEPEVIKPSRGAWQSGPVLVAGLFLLAAFTTYRRNEDVVIAVGVLVAGAVIVAGVVVAVLRARLEVRPGEVTRRGVLRSTRVTAASLDRIVWIPALQAPQGNKFRSRVVAVSRSGAAELRLSEGMIWSKEAVVAVARALATGARVVTVDQPVAPGMLKQVEPVALSWGERNPGMVVVLSLLGTFGVLALLFGIFVLTS